LLAKLCKPTVGGLPANGVVRGRLDDRIELVELVRRQPLLDGAPLEPELQREIRERVPADAESDVGGTNLPFGRRRFDEGGDVDHRGQRREPVLAHVLGAVEPEQRVREVSLHQLRRPFLPGLELAFELLPMLPADRLVKEEAGRGRGASSRSELRDSSLAP